MLFGLIITLLICLLHLYIFAFTVASQWYSVLFTFSTKFVKQITIAFAHFSTNFFFFSSAKRFLILELQYYKVDSALRYVCMKELVVDTKSTMYPGSAFMQGKKTVFFIFCHSFFHRFYKLFISFHVS